MEPELDTALDINLGQANIGNFGAKDLLVTTTKIYDSNNDGIIDFGSNKLLDLPAGSQVAINDQHLTQLALDDHVTHKGVDYHVYGKVGAHPETHLDFVV